MKQLIQFWKMVFIAPVQLNFIIAAAFVAAAVSAGAAIAQGRATAAAEKERRKRLDQQIEQQRIQSLDDETNRRRELLFALGSQAAIGGQSGFDPFDTGTSFLAVKEDTEEVAQKDINAIRLLGVNNIANLTSQKIESKIVGRNAKIQGYLSATGTLLSAGVQAESLRGGGTLATDAQGNSFRTTTQSGQFNSAGRQNRRL